MYEWSDLRIFLAVVRAGSALGAAKTLGLNQTTVNRRIQALEHALRLTLFDRQNRGHTLTEHGTALLASVEHVARATSDVQSAAERLRRTVAGVVRVTAPEAIANRIIIPIATDFQKQHPDVRVEQIAADSRLDIVHGEADIAFRLGNHPDEPRLIGQRLPDSIWGVYCSTAYAEANGFPENAAMICKYDIICFEGTLKNSTVQRWLADNANTARIVGRSNTVPNMRAVICSGLGVGTLPRFVGDAEQNLKHCLDTPKEINSEFWLLTSREARSSPQVRAFIDFAVPRIFELRHILAGQLCAD